MKRIILLLIAFGFIFSNAQAAVTRTATFGDQNSSGAYRMAADTDNTTGAGYITFAQNTGIIMPYVTATTTTTLTAFQSGTTLVVTPIANTTRVNLPAATVGLIYTIVDSAAFSLAVYPATGETIKFASLAASAGLVNSSTPAKGDSLELICSVAGVWDVRNMRNTWVSIAP